MTPNTDGPQAGRATQQQTPPSTAGMTSKKGETLPQGTLAFSGRKQGLPSEFGRYRVQKLLGGGGMGAVYLVVNTELEREEALKVPHFDAADDPQVRERFLREAKAAAGLDHPNLCPVYDVGVRDGIYYLTMRYLKGKLLSEYSGSAQPPREAAEIVVKLAQALATAHAKGVIHRDLKPNNIMMCADVGPVVMDFGLAKQTDRQDQALTQMGTTLGTPAYMPPEQVKGELDRMGPASDVYSLGVILFQLLTGRLPFEGRTAEVYGNILHVEAPAPSSLRPGLPAALDAICAKAMAKRPEGRYASMREFAAALIDYPNASATVSKSGKSRSRRLIAVGALVLLMLGGLGAVGAYYWITSANTPAPSTPLALTQSAMAPAATPVEPSVEPTPAAKTFPVEASVKETPAPKTVPVEAAVNPSPMQTGPASSFQSPPNKPNNPIGPSFKHLPEPEAEPVEPILPVVAPLSAQATHPVEALPDGVIANSIGMKLKLIKAGKFLMGAPVSKKNGSGDEQPQHETAIAQPFCLGVYPVTKAQFAAFVSDADYKTEAEKADDKSTWRDPGFEQTDDDPVVCVSWKDAEKFCAWLSEREKRTYHLPSEAQWEYACRAGTTTAYSFGDDPKMLDDFAWYGDNSESHTHPVGAKTPNPWGLYDMHGNVWQWCVDSYNAGHYQKTSKGLQFILDTNKGVWRGGSWSGSTRDCRAASRLNYSPSNRNSNYGLRVCLRLN